MRVRSVKCDVRRLSALARSCVIVIAKLKVKLEVNTCAFYRLKSLCNRMMIVIDVKL